MEEGRYGEAIDLLNRYISAFPQDETGYNLRGLSYEKRKQFEYAVYDFRTAKRLSPKNEEILSNLNRATGEWYKLIYNKIEGYKREIAINSRNAVNYLEIGKAYKNLGEWNEAEIWYDEYLAMEHASPDEIIRYSEILAKNNHLVKGEKILKKYVDEYPDDHRLWSRYGYFTLWLGKNEVAIEAFKKALELRPFFKEAMDGLDRARGKGYIYTVNDTSTYFNYGIPVSRPVYKIDQYIKKLNRNPDDNDTRIKLVEELIKANRFDEAHKNLLIITNKLPDSDVVAKLLSEFEKNRNEFYKNEIEKLKNFLAKDPSNKKTLLKISDYYSSLRKYDDAERLLEEYLKIHFSDIDARYKLAQIYGWNKKLHKSKEQADLLIGLDPNNTDFQLLAAQIRLWTNDDLDESESLFRSVLKSDPNNKRALIGLAWISFNKNELASAKDYLNKIKLADPLNSSIIELDKSIRLQQKRNKQAESFNLLEKGRIEVLKGNCNIAVDYFEEFISKTEPEKKILLELAGVYLCADEQDKAFSIYRKILDENEDDVNTRMIFAKNLLWSENYLEAIEQFEIILNYEPDNIEALLYLGDSFFEAADLQKAEEIYLKLTELSPDSYTFNNRLNWLGKDYGEDLFGMPTHFQLKPFVLFFTDDADFSYNLQGANFEFGLTKHVSLGASLSRGNLDSDSTNLSFYSFNGLGFIRFNRNVSLSFALGQDIYQDRNNSFIAEINMNAVKQNKYRLNGFLYSTNAARILYSARLVNETIRSTIIGTAGEYNISQSILLYGKYSFITVSDDNKANQIYFRLGKVFDDELTAGYEFWFYDFINDTPLYWSPDNFEAHSIWTKWNLISNKEVKIDLFGKIGLIPDSDFILRELTGTFQYRFTEKLSFYSTLTSSSTAQDDAGYSSFSVQFSLNWNF